MPSIRAEIRAYSSQKDNPRKVWLRLRRNSVIPKTINAHKPGGRIIKMSSTKTYPAITGAGSMSGRRTTQAKISANIRSGAGQPSQLIPVAPGSRVTSPSPCKGKRRNSQISAPMPMNSAIYHNRLDRLRSAIGPGRIGDRGKGRRNIWRQIVGQGRVCPIGGFGLAVGARRQDQITGRGDRFLRARPQHAPEIPAARNRRPTAPASAGRAT